ncbi:hypothetical protein HOLDEFILI_02620 [Holdemania filiformis DSM 12042]|uniref:Uncharacterized protein n=1 Tax=Holdemania filiformis DSM 12042 TaxID=545696 RepID=B9Y9W3_9FIRM|nr:hypothetical protein HOLDEFILI_02620 [Holdemania filiformis DSM 12042]
MKDFSSTFSFLSLSLLCFLMVCFCVCIADGLIVRYDLSGRSGFV